MDTVMDTVAAYATPLDVDRSEIARQRGHHMSALDLSRLYRVVVGSPDSRTPERVAFVEATNGRAAIKKVAASIAGLEYRSPSAVEERLYNVQSAQECVDAGLSDDVELRVFETGWNGRAPTYIEQPLFLVAAPATLIRAWSRCSHEAR